MCPFPTVHGNRTRFAGLLQWLRQQGYRVIFILQPLDVENAEGLSRLREVVDRLEVVQSDGLRARVTAAVRRRCLALARAIVPVGPRRLLGRALRRGRGSEPPLNEVWGSGDVGGDGHIDRWCWPNTCRAVQRAVHRERPIAVVTEYALLSKCLEALPSQVLKVVDTVELFSRNPERFEVPGLTAPKVCSQESEAAALRRADLLVAIQRNDAEALTKGFPRARVITLPHAYPQTPRRSEGPQRGTVLYVASSNPFNVHGLREFIANAWPSIAARLPSATLRIVGSIPADTSPKGIRISYVGRVSDAALVREYQDAHVVINPQVAGTGLKIKCVEALSAGCPLVTNRAGADGLEEGEGKAFLVATDWRDFADRVVTLLTHEHRRLVLEAEARAFAARLFSSEAAFSELAEILAHAARRPSSG